MQILSELLHNTLFFLFLLHRVGFKNLFDLGQKGHRKAHRRQTMTIEKMTQRAQQAVRTRKKIFDVSIELIREHGFDGVTIENISKKAGVSVGAFYHYFETKSQVIFEIMNRIDEHFEKEVKSQLNGTSFEKITAFFGFYADYVLLSDLVFIRRLYTTENKILVKKDIK